MYLRLGGRKGRLWELFRAPLPLRPTRLFLGPRSQVCKVSGYFCSRFRSPFSLPLSPPPQLSPLFRASYCGSFTIKQLPIICMFDLPARSPSTCLSKPHFQRNACFAYSCLRRSFSKALEIRTYISEDCHFVLNKVGQHPRLPISSAFLATDNAGYIAICTTIHAKAFRSQVGHGSRYASH
jgi:hypothetical protein